ncbi:MAG: histidine kinase [Planctomycetes bacterium]|nr:histidine kinase [Planctomycetota bacterium]
MPKRVRRILLVASAYDSFILEQDGQLSDLILTELLDPNLRNVPSITSVSTGAQALEIAAKRRFDLVITTSELGDMDERELARRLRERGIATPIVLLVFENRDPSAHALESSLPDIERVFVWQGDRRILLGIISHLEDRWNVAHDTRVVGVSTIILIEDNPRYYSAFLPLLYAELMKQTRKVIAEGTNLSNKLTRMRARPKILLCSDYEEAWRTYKSYQRTVLGIISDVDFPRDGKLEPQAGLDFARAVREEAPELPIMLQTLDPQAVRGAADVGAEVVLKNSPHLLHQLGRFVTERFGFGDFVFRTGDLHEVGRASNLRTLLQLLGTVPDESIHWHAERNHFSTWLRARTEFRLAEQLRPRRLGDFESIAQVRELLVDSIRTFRRERQSGTISDFDPAGFDTLTSFARIGSGSLGGKARGMAFCRDLLHRQQLGTRFPHVRIFVPSAVVLATGVFEQFLDQNRLRDFAIEEEDDARIQARFLEARLPEEVFEALQQYVDLVDYPLAVRSSSLLEDSPTLPFAGVYATYMVPNAHADRKVRTMQLAQAIKRVYASTFFRDAKAYMRTTPYRLEEEQMAVILQRLVGRRHGTRFYPDFAGAARSHNFYPTPPMRAEDGIAAVALGLGQTVVSGRRALRFSPRYPRHPVQFSTPEEILANAQSGFYALELDPLASEADAGLELVLHELDRAVEDGTLAPLASTWSPENDSVRDGLGREGLPLVTFAPILKQKSFPLPEILELLLETVQRGLNVPAEIEFAVNFAATPSARAEFAFLQMRPVLVPREGERVELAQEPREKLVCRSTSVLGNGRLEGIRDLVVVDRERFDRARSAEIAFEIAALNAQLVLEQRPYALIGVGRWGASDPWLGIPVRWEAIAGARAIVECAFRDLAVVPSQGSHFFQNLVSSRVGYFTIKDDAGDFVDWEWLAGCVAQSQTEFVRHLRFEQPLAIAMDGRCGAGSIARPA